VRVALFFLAPFHRPQPSIIIQAGSLIMPQSFKKILIYLALLLGLIYGYRFLTGESIIDLPMKIHYKIQQSGEEKPTESANPHYYRDPAKDLPEDLRPKNKSD